MRRAVYLDNNATVPLRPEAREAADAAMDLAGNASSVHGHGRAARRIIDESRDTVAGFVGVPSSWVTFTSGGTEANALAFRASVDRPALVSAIEHASVFGQRTDAYRIPVDADGRVDLKALEARLESIAKPAFVSVMLANNETGVLQPVASVAEIAHRHGAIVHCDAVQGLGRVDVDWGRLDVDLMSVSAHKLGGLAGCGALIANPAIAINPLWKGGGQERSRRCGTENVCGIAAFGAVADVGFRPDETERLQCLRDTLEASLLSIEPTAQVIGRDAPRLPNTICLATPGMNSETLVIALDLLGISVSAGAACSSGKVSESHVLAAMGLDPILARSAVRISLGWTNTDADVERMSDAWRAVCMRMHGEISTGVTAA